jgi:indole-3-glycerol phosphate synthase
VARRRAARPERVLEEQIQRSQASRPLAPALRQSHLTVIAEMKAKTPIRGDLTAGYAPRSLAKVYEQAGAAAISVLCQETSFGGHPEHLAEARAVSSLPLLRKDFIVTEHQVLEARADGADAVLLIAAALSLARMQELFNLIKDLDMEALVEVHDRSEVDQALSAGASLVGVNHRDLTTFEIDLGLTERLRPLVPPQVVLVSESGVRDAGDARRLREAGADAILVGETLMRASDPSQVIRELSVT